MVMHWVFLEFTGGFSFGADREVRGKPKISPSTVKNADWEEFGGDSFTLGVFGALSCHFKTSERPSA